MEQEEKCFMLKQKNSVEWQCSALTHTETNCGPECKFYKTRDQQLAIERELYERLKSKYPLYDDIVKNYKSCVTGERYSR